MSSKEYVKVGEEITLNYGHGLPARDRKPGPYQVIGSSGIVDTHQDFVAQGPGIVVGRKGTVGALTWLEKDFWPIDTTYYVTLNRESDLKYWYYQLHNLRLSSLNSHAAVPGLNRDDVYRIEVIKRSKDEQKEIGKILGDLDRKIELNRRMNETLEQIGQTLFKNYFIDNPESEGWGQTTLGSMVIARRGNSLLRKDMNEGNVPVVSGGLEPSGYHNKSNTVSPVITVSGSGANAGFIRLWNENVWSADSAFIDKTITEYVYFVYIFLKSQQDKIYSMQTGAAQPHIYPSHLERLEVVNVPQVEIASFEKLVTPLFEQIGTNEKETISLIKVRDLLLPKLMNGQIGV